MIYNQDSFVVLNNGYKIPLIAFGPGSLKIAKCPLLFQRPPILKKVIQKINYYRAVNNKINAIANSIKNGYRLIDYSASYVRESMIGEAILRSGISREKLFLISKSSNRNQYDGNIRDSFMNTLKAYRTDYIDLYMFHWPVTDHYIKTYKEIERLYKEGHVKAIGVCNCHIHHLQKILNECTIVPAVDMFEVHPLFTQKPLIDFCESHKIRVMAYTPMAINDYRLFSNPILKSLSLKYNKSIPQVILRWHIQQGRIPIPHSNHSNRQKENIDIFDFELTNDELLSIDSININSRLRYDSDNLDFTSIG